LSKRQVFKLGNDLFIAGVQIHLFNLKRDAYGSTYTITA
jgi:hypothetical protein